MKPNDKDVLTLEQLVGLLSQIYNKKNHRRKHLSERMIAWDQQLRKGRHDYGAAVQHLVVAWNNKGDKLNYSWEYDLEKESLAIHGESLKVFSSDNSVGAGKCLLRFIGIKRLDISSTKLYRLEDIIGLNKLEELDIRNTLVTNLKALHKLPSLKRLVINQDQYSKKVLSKIPEWVRVLEK